MDISAATLAANSLQWANDGTGSERHHAQRLVSHMIAKPWSHKQKDRHAAVSPKSDQVLGYVESLRPHFTISLNAIWRFWATSIALHDIAGPLWRV